MELINTKESLKIQVRMLKDFMSDADFDKIGVADKVVFADALSNASNRLNEAIQELVNAISQMKF